VRLVNTKAHALIDYCWGLVLLFSPWLFSFPSDGEAATIARIAGVLSVLLALFTQFEFSVVKIVPLKWHLRIDFLSGLFLASSPWLLDFNLEILKPHLVFGLTQMVIAVITDRVLYQTFRETSNRGENSDENGSPETTKRKNYL
jgi:hypothetical protein